MREGNLPLIGVRQSNPSFLEAALEARRALAGATTDASVNDAASRMVVQLHGLGECIAGMAETGLLNVDITATNLQTQTRLVDGQWTSHTRVMRLPPRYCQDIKLPPDVCNALMQTLVIFDAIEHDTGGELVEMRDMAAMVVADWPDLTSSSIGQALQTSLRVAWQAHAPSSPSDTAARLTRALSEKLRGAARAAGGGDTEGTDTALEYARATLQRLSG
jgi:hypothetical protein